MALASTIGHIALNINTVLYGVLYLPQLWRNRDPARFSQMSFAFHAILLTALACDLYYAFGRIIEWQYQLVGTAMFAALVVQHLQWWPLANRAGYRRRYLLLTLVVMLLLTGLLLCLSNPHTPLSYYIAMGWVARLGYWSYSVPQILKNRHLQASDAVSPWFLVMCLAIHLLDAMAAWTLHWGSPSLYGTPIGLTLHGVLVYQYLAYNGRLNQRHPAAA